jgi:hypothetical protein
MHPPDGQQIRPAAELVLQTSQIPLQAPVGCYGQVVGQVMPHHLLAGIEPDLGIPSPRPPALTRLQQQPVHLGRPDR